MKREEDKRGQAEDIKVARLLGTAAAEIDKQTDDEVSEADKVLIDDGAIERHLTDDDVFDREFDAAADDGVGGLLPGTDGREDFGDLDGVLDGKAVDGGEAIASANA